jgi:hypothetical protein
VIQQDLPRRIFRLPHPDTAFHEDAAAAGKAERVDGQAVHRRSAVSADGPQEGFDFLPHGNYKRY